MKTKKHYLLFHAVAALLCTASLAACSDDDTYDFPGDAHNRVYLKDNSTDYKIVQTPISTVSNLDFTTDLKCTQRASAEIRATIEVDNSLIDAYNEENGTQYEAMPSAALAIENATLTIPAGQMATADTFRITTTTDEATLSALRSTNGYLIPLRISKTEGGNASPSTNVYSTYLTVTITEDNINHDATEADITGTLVADQSGWSATTNGSVQSYYEPIETLFDGDESTYCYIYSSEDLNLDIDMGKQYTFDAITLWYGYDYGWGAYEEGSLTSGMTIYTSNDGTTWQSAGEITGSSSKVCVFYAPLTTRYLRIHTPQGSWRTSLMGGVFNVYAK